MKNSTILFLLKKKMNIMLRRKVNCKEICRHPVYPGLLIRALSRYKFLKSNRKKMEHVVTHYPSFGFSWDSPLFDCQMKLVEKARKEIPYSDRTATKDIMWRLYNDWKKVCKEI